MPHSPQPADPTSSHVVRALPLSLTCGLLLPQEPANEGERAEQLEVASQCLCDAFEIDLDAAAPEFSLAEIYRAGVESLVRPPLLCFAAAFR